MSGSTSTGDAETEAATGGDTSSDRAAGTAVKKVGGRALVTGDATYVDDVPTTDALAGAILRSPHAHARIVDIDTSEAESMDGVRTVVTPDDVPDHRFTREGLARPTVTPYDERVLHEKARFVGDAVCAVAADTEAAAEAALAAIDVEYDVLDHVLDPAAAMGDDAPTIHDEANYENAFWNADLDRNVVGEIEHERGDVEAGFERSDAVVEDVYRTQIVQHAQMERNTTIAWIDDRERLVVRTGTQIPHVAKAILGEIFDIPRHKIRVINPRVGGGFGVKQDVVPSQFIACLLALETGEKVRIANSRADDLHVAQTRHSVETRVKTGVTEDGRVTSIELDALANTGAYACHGIATLSNGCHEALALYPGANLKMSGRVVYTNCPVAGAMRGYGAPVVSFAVESNLDKAAEAIGMDPLELRRGNHVQTGDPTFDSESTVTDETATIGSCELAECIDAARRAIGWEEDRDPDEPNRHRGVGMALAMHRSGIPEHELAGADLDLEMDGTCTLRMGIGDTGQGAETVMAQIVASVLDVPIDMIDVRTADTDMTPYDNGAYASSTTYVSGLAAQKAALDLADQIRGAARRLLAGETDEFVLSNGQVINDRGDAVSFEDVSAAVAQGETGQRTRLRGSGEHYTGHSPRPFAAQAAEVEVDSNSGEFSVTKFVSAVDCGVAINPETARGQVIGGAVMGIGQAISEELVLADDGTPRTTGISDYGQLRSTDIPDEHEVILVESYEPTGPFGAKSIGEVVTIGPLAAINNAIYDAVGVQVPELPITTEKIADRLE